MCRKASLPLTTQAVSPSSPTMSGDLLADLNTDGAVDMPRRYVGRFRFVGARVGAKHGLRVPLRRRL
jgi:hypothetical protein